MVYIAWGTAEGGMQTWPHFLNDVRSRRTECLLARIDAVPNVLDASDVCQTLALVLILWGLVGFFAHYSKVK